MEMGETINHPLCGCVTVVIGEKGKRQFDVDSIRKTAGAVWINLIKNPNKVPFPETITEKKEEIFNICVNFQ